MKSWARVLSAYVGAVAVATTSAVVASPAQAATVTFAPVFNTLNASGVRDDSGVAALTDTAWLGPKLTKYKGSTTLPTATAFYIGGLSAGNTVAMEWGVTNPAASTYAAPLAGTITSTITSDDDTPTDSKIAMYNNATWLNDIDLYPTNTFPRMNGHVWFSFANSGGYTLNYDFSGLDGGVLPAGSAIMSSDVDVCATEQSESQTFASDASGEWLSWPITKDDGSGSHVPAMTPVGSFDTDTNVYTLVSASCSGNSYDQSYLVTTEDITTLSVHVAEPIPSATGAGSWFSFYVNAPEASSSVSLVKKLNGSQITSAPGPELAAGSSIEWTYEVTNTGNVALSNATVTDDQVPDADIDCGDGTNVIALLLPGADPVTCTATDTAGSSAYTNSATVTATPSTNAGVAFTDSAAPASVTATDSAWYQGEAAIADITLDAAVNTSTVEVGQAVTWTVTVTNQGAGDADDAVATFTFPDGVTPDASSLPAGATITGQVVVIPVGSLSAGASESYTLTGSVISDATGDLTGVLAATAANTDDTDAAVTAVDASACDSDSDQACATTTVVAIDLSASVSAPSSVVAGSTFDYTVTIGNTGGTDSEDTVATFTLPEGVTLVTAPAGATVNGRTITWPVGTLAAGAEQSFTIKVLAELDSSGSVSATIAATGESPAGNTADASASTTVTIVASVTPTPTPGTEVRTFQVDRYKVNSKKMGKKVAKLASDGKLRYREDRFAWGRSQWQFVRVTVSENATTAQLIAAINAKTSKRVGDVAKTSRKVNVIKKGSITIAWELGTSARPTAKRGLAWGKRHNISQAFVAWR
jgi:uncharacterized repeat protein (TIGR01451 family)